MSEEKMVAVFGSAVRYVRDGRTGRIPRDINVARCGVEDAEAIALAQKWARRSGLSGTPIRIMRIGDGVLAIPRPDGHLELSLPTPQGMELALELLFEEGGVKVEPFVLDHLSSWLRLAEQDPERAAAGIRRLGQNTVWGGRPRIGYAVQTGGRRWDDPDHLVSGLRDVRENFLFELGELGRVLGYIKAAGDRWPDRCVRPAAIDQIAPHAMSSLFGRIDVSLRRDGLWQFDATGRDPSEEGYMSWCDGDAIWVFLAG